MEHDSFLQGKIDRLENRIIKLETEISKKENEKMEDIFTAQSRMCAICGKEILLKETCFVVEDSTKIHKYNEKSFSYVCKDCYEKNYCVKDERPEILKNRIAMLETQNKDLLYILKNYKSTEQTKIIVVDKKKKLSLDQHDAELKAKWCEKLLEWIKENYRVVVLSDISNPTTIEILLKTHLEEKLEEMKGETK